MKSLNDEKFPNGMLYQTSGGSYAVILFFAVGEELRVNVLPLIDAKDKEYGDLQGNQFVLVWVDRLSAPTTGILELLEYETVTIDSQIQFTMEGLVNDASRDLVDIYDYAVNDWLSRVG